MKYLKRFAHIGCGGHPVAYVNTDQIGCTKCTAKWDGAGPLGEAILATLEFDENANLAGEPKGLFD